LASAGADARARGLAGWLPAVAAAALTACGVVEDCGGVLGNKEDPRIRSSAVRMLLKDPAAASARFAPYAAMAALVYEEASSCRHELPPVEYKADLAKLLSDGGWTRYDAVPNLPACDDDIGTFYRIWVKEHADHQEVDIVFRGTKGGMQDWITGNLRWLTRLLPGDDQYDRSRRYAGQVLGHVKKVFGGAGARKPLRIYAVGHSLGGGLAQNVLYAFPNDILQAYAFDPSPVTGYADNAIPERRAACDCLARQLSFEARVYRIYETDEVLAWLRFPLKLAVPLNRHVQEVRLNFGNGHSMSGLAKGMADASKGRARAVRGPWWAGRSASDGRSCTDDFAASLTKSCAQSNAGDACPQ
jgi:hypothetical protein